MKPHNFLRSILSFALVLLSLCAVLPSANAQSPQPFPFEVGYAWPAQGAGTGSFGAVSAIGLQYFSIDWVVSGTVSGCTVTLDGAQTLQSFSTGSIISSQTCTSTGTFATSSATENLQARLSYSITGTGTVTFLVRGFAISGSSVASSVAVTNFPTSQNVVCTSGCNGSNASVSTAGAGVPLSATFIAGKNGSGDLQGLSTDSSGNLNVNVISGGGSNASVGTNGSSTPTSSTALGAANGGNLVQLAADSSSNLDTDLAKVGGSALGLGQTTMSASVPVVVASNQSNLPANVAQVAGNNVSTAASGVQKVGVVGNGGVALDVAAGGTAATNSLLTGGAYNSSPPAPTSGEQEPLQLDSSANLKVNVATALPAGTNAIGTVAPSLSSGALVNGEQAVTATAAALPSTSLTRPACIQALTGNSLTVYVGTSGVTTSTGFPLPAGASLCNLPVSNLNQVYVIASSTGSSVAWVAQ